MIGISKKFLKSTFLYTVAGSLPMASAVILLPFYLLYLSTDNYGALSLYFAFSVFVQIITTYSFDTGMYIFFHEHRKNERVLKQYVSSVFVFLLITGFVAAAFFIVTGNFLVETIFTDWDISFYPFGVMAVFTGVFQSIFKVHSSLLQTSERPGLFFWSNLLSFSLIAGITFLGLKFYPQTLWGPLGGRLVAAVVSGVWVLFRVGIIYGKAFRFSLLRESFRFNHPSLLYQLQQWSMNYFDRFIMLFSLIPLSAIGVYDFAVKCMLAIEFIISGVYNSFYPKVIGIVMNQETKMSSPEINRYYHGLIAVIMVLVCLAILGFSIIIDLKIIGSGYEASVELLPLIGVIYLVRAIRFFFSFPYGALKFSRPLPLIYLFISLFKIGVIIALIPYYDVYAVIGAGIASTFLEVLLLWYFVKKRFEFHFNKFKIIFAPLLLAGIIIGFQAVDYFPPMAGYVTYLLICVLVLGILYRRELAALTSGRIFR